MEDDDLLAVDRAAEILHRHLQRLQAAGAGEVAVGTGHVGQIADTDFVVADLGLGGRGDQGSSQDGACALAEKAHVVTTLDCFCCGSGRRPLRPVYSFLSRPGLTPRDRN